MITIDIKEAACTYLPQGNNSEADEYYGIIRVCYNPMCVCENIHFDMQNMRAQEDKVSFSINLKKRKFTKKEPISEAGRKLGKKFIKQLKEKDWDDLYKLYYFGKTDATENGKLEDIKASFPWEDIEKFGDVVGYNEILPYGKNIVFEYNSKKYFVDDLYCVKADCKCTLSYLVFFYYDKNIEIQEYDPCIRFDYKNNKWKVVKEGKGDFPPVADLFQELLKVKTSFPDLLKKRHQRLKTLYKNFIKDSGIIIDPDEDGKFDIKIGRNDPCPCGSGKKYKKCCLGKSL